MPTFHTDQRSANQATNTEKLTIPRQADLIFYEKIIVTEDEQLRPIYQDPMHALVKHQEAIEKEKTPNNQQK